MKVVIFLTLTIACIAMAQRPSYAPNPVGYPGLASRFQTNDDDVQAQVALNNRAVEVNGTTERIPIDARGDYDLIRRISQWPPEKQPFWYKNYIHIENARNQPYPRPANTPQEQPGVGQRFGEANAQQQPSLHGMHTAHRSSFLGRREN